MSYIIRASVIHNNEDQNVSFRIVEKTIWNYTTGTWDNVDGDQILTMGGSGSSGGLRFIANTGENFFIVFGIHNFKRWGDIVPDLPDNETGVTTHPQYYIGDHPKRTAAREAQRPAYSVKDSSGRSISYDFTTAEGNNLVVNIIIG
jgi:hypothetical protein